MYVLLVGAVAQAPQKKNKVDLAVRKKDPSVDKSGKKPKSGSDPVAESIKQQKYILPPFFPVDDAVKTVRSIPEIVRGVVDYFK